MKPPIGGTFDVTKLGYSFRKFRGRVVDGKRFECKPDRKGIAKWWVTSAAKGAGDAGDAGDRSGGSDPISPNSY
jgi:hypothetical protein